MLQLKETKINTTTAAKTQRKPHLGNYWTV